MKGQDKPERWQRSTHLDEVIKCLEVENLVEENRGRAGKPPAEEVLQQFYDALSLRRLSSVPDLLLQLKLPRRPKTRLHPSQDTLELIPSSQLAHESNVPSPARLSCSSTNASSSPSRAGLTRERIPHRPHALLDAEGSFSGSPTGASERERRERGTELEQEVPCKPDASGMGMGCLTKGGNEGKHLSRRWQGWKVGGRGGKGGGRL